jgi:polyphosphate kinase
VTNQNIWIGPKMGNPEYTKELRKLRVELVRLRGWLEHKGLCIIIVFEGGDRAGKGGTIKAITERVSPRAFRLVALPAPSDRERDANLHAALPAAFPGGR